MSRNGARTPKLLLLRLTERQSAAGEIYMSGRLGLTRVIGFRGEPDERGNTVWDVYVTEAENLRRDEGSR